MSLNFRPQCFGQLTLEWQRKPTYSSSNAGKSTKEKTTARSRAQATMTHRFHRMSAAPQATQQHLPLRLPHALPPLWATRGGSIFTPSPIQNSSSFSSSPEPPSSMSTSMPHILRQKERFCLNQNCSDSDCYCFNLMNVKKKKKDVTIVEGWCAVWDSLCL